MEFFFFLSSWKCIFTFNYNLYPQPLKSFGWLSRFSPLAFQLHGNLLASLSKHYRHMKRKVKIPLGAKSKIKIKWKIFQVYIKIAALIHPKVREKPVKIIFHIFTKRKKTLKLFILIKIFENFLSCVRDIESLTPRENENKGRCWRSEKKDFFLEQRLFINFYF